jgi:ATP-dependent DNA ligase
LRPPIDLALAKAVESIPRGDVLAGGSVFEMKFDGFRAVCLVGSDEVWLYSRQGKDLSRYSVGVKRRRADLWPGESAVISARQVSLTCLRSGRSFRHSLRFLRVRPELDPSEVMVPEYLSTGMKTPGWALFH